MRIRMVQAVAAVGAVAAIAAAFALSQRYVDGDTPPVATGDRELAAALGEAEGLRPLAEGMPRIDDGHALVGTVTPEQLLESSPLIFVGVPIARGASEVVSEADPSEPIAALTAHRVRFAVEKVLRGKPAEAIDLSLLDVDPDYDRFVLGDRYLIFAQTTELGSSRTPAVIPNGYYQGSFEFKDQRIAENSRKDAFDVTELAKKLGKGDEK